MNTKYETNYTGLFLLLLTYYKTREMLYFQNQRDLCIYKHIIIESLKFQVLFGCCREKESGAEIKMGRNWLCCHSSPVAKTSEAVVQDSNDCSTDDAEVIRHGFDFHSFNTKPTSISQKHAT